MTKQIIAFSPSDVTVQIVPQSNQQNNTIVSIPDESIGFTSPMNLFFVDNMGSDLCGVFEIKTIYYNEAIKNDIINDLSDSGTNFDIYVRQKSSKENITSPKILQIFNNVHMHGREFIIPELGNTITYRYYFTNCNDPWSIPIEKIEAMRPPNQYIYDYAVSKAVKDLKYPIENVTKTLLEIKAALCPEPEQAKILTPSEYVASCQAGKL